MLIRRRKRHEHGGIAIMFALMVTMLLTLAALGTDLGNAISRKTDTQNQADFAAFDVGKEHATEIAAATPGTPVSAALAADVAASFNNNQPQDDDSACANDNTCVSADQLTDCPATPNDTCLANGEVRFVAGHALEVNAPLARIDFGFANVFGVDGTTVSSKATVGVYSAGPRILPMFAVAGCDWGRQTLTSPSNAEEIVPDLESGEQDGPGRPNAPTVYDASNNAVTSLTPGSSTPYVMVIDANQWQKTWKIGFFRESGTPRTIVVEGTSIRSAADTTLPAGPPVTSLTGTTAVNIVIPPAVYAEEGTWWIRAWGGKNTIVDPDNEWSPVSGPGSYRAPSIEVGTPTLECDAGPTDGNFGTLILPRSIPYQPTQLPANIALGLKDPLNLVKHQQYTSSGLCEDGVNGAVESDTALKEDTNCLDTDTGLPANVATEGFITYNSGNGLLAGKETRSGCDPDGGSDERGVDVQGSDAIDYYINDDILSCYLLPGHTLAEAVDPDYNPLSDAPVFSSDVLKSPRFAYVPVFNVRPDDGGSHRYSITDFRPAFITDQNPTCFAPSYCVTSDNGLTIGQSGVTHMKVLFFAMDSWERDGDVPLIDYLGVGEAIPHLID